MRNRRSYDEYEEHGMDCCLFLHHSANAGSTNEFSISMVGAESSRGRSQINSLRVQNLFQDSVSFFSSNHEARGLESKLTDLYALSRHRAIARNVNEGLRAVVEIRLQR